ncbi:hypothetical protein [Sphingomonas sp. PAMC 26617]|uniref:hypothetical protein n=1 Tax=Sphingomonas sp. PAMC 26617 TaxID=1112216 RepID=UPI00028970A0|nr:hypothetical protein [Sphingomonas sp. PAMC 26617]
MEWLLFFSAILSALTGVVTGVRAPDMQVECQSIAAARAQVALPARVLRIAGHRHLAGGFGETPVFALSHLTLPVIATARLYLDRPRA